MAGHIGRGVRGEEDGGALIIGRCAQAAHRGIGEPGGLCFVFGVCGHRRQGMTGADGIDANPAPGPFGGTDSGQLESTGFGGVVMAVQLWAVDDVRRDRDDIDDRSGTSLQHDFALGLTAEEDALEVDVEDPVPVGFADVFYMATDSDAGAINADIELAPGSEHGVDCVIDFVFEGDIGGDSQGLAA